MRINPLTAIDFYKADHRRQYPEGTTKVYSNFTPRSAKLADPTVLKYAGENVVFFGLQGFIKSFLIDAWNQEFFAKPKAEVVAAYKRRLDTSLGVDAVPVDHIESLHDLGYLPLTIKALPEGTLTPVRVPVLTITNTHPDYFWLVNYLETALSAALWKPCTTATIAHALKRILSHYCKETGGIEELVPFQAHDFSFRGMSGIEDAMISGSGHLLSFTGTDTVAAIDYLERHYDADCTASLIGGSAPATEHSVMCMGGQEDEIGTFKRLITETYPSGIVSIVSDTWDFWKVITEYCLSLKDVIVSREGKLVIRPDSGCPVKIICGDPDATEPCVQKGAVECLWEIFGGTITSTGHKLLDSHIGLIYGDSITPGRMEEILSRLQAKGFCSSNVVFGVGSYTYQYLTRDTYGFAMKATYGEVNGQPRIISKNPKTDNGVKKSAKGLLIVEQGADGLVMTDNQPSDEAGLLATVFENGKLHANQTLGDIRAKLLTA
jgi:nicotinamide phosphoribosyltransferase